MLEVGGEEVVDVVGCVCADEALGGLAGGRGGRLEVAGGEGGEEAGHLGVEVVVGAFALLVAEAVCCAGTGEEGGESSVPDSAWIVTDGVTVVTGTDEEDAAPAYDVGVSAVGTVLSLLDRPEEPGLREGL